MMKSNLSGRTGTRSIGNSRFGFQPLTLQEMGVLVRRKSFPGSPGHS
ncbi:hypothetical protein DGo_PD0005 (plasmid) [Deinococcus gobiensis I-0]|uniref:Uncharacterized protein n=1 Tax=Deinococcus gobiensis (strain DSM 21396 / JCM 16679 / CGMCC 1.7299 / I-0) TaxID=745776 RepID=H8H3I2_DEIGI|nr:hypothetical protein DGo_PD0005 [Deinococcus gobiensis I-0]